MWGKFAGFFVLLLPLGYGLAVSAWLAPHACIQCPTFRFIVFGGKLLPLLSLVANLGELRLRSKVLIRTGLGTVAVLVGSVVSLVNFRNYLGVVIGTWYILADLYWLVCDDI